jgi:hypothetical protein
MKRGSSIRHTLAGSILLCGALAFASPALAQGWITIPEPTDLTLFALGVLGLIIGRRGARRNPRD